MLRPCGVMLALIGTMVLAISPCRGQGPGQVTNIHLDKFLLDGNTSAFTIDTCDTNTKLFALGGASVSLTVVGQPVDYRYELLRDTTVVAADNGYIGIFEPNKNVSLPPFGATIPAASGTYKLRVYVDGVQLTSPGIKFTLKQRTGTPTAKPLINGAASDNVAVCPGGPITLNGSKSACASGYFVGIEFSDQNWDSLGGGGGSWIGDREQQRYGPISSFDVKKFAEDRYIRFVGGQYYRVKLAVGAPWDEHTQLIYIQPTIPKPLINGDAHDRVAVCPDGPIVLDGSKSVCASGYYVGIELSDENFSHLGGGGGGWIGDSERQKYGPIDNFDVKKFAEDRFVRFVSGQHYLVKLAVGPVGNWNERTQLISIDSPASSFTINGKGGPGQVVHVLSTDPIRLDGSGSTCAESYFVSVQEVDVAGNARSVEVGRWLTNADLANLGGSIKAFDVKGFAKSLAQFRFAPGQYYRVKLAVGPTWQESIELVAIEDPCICATINCMIPASCQTIVW